MPDRRPRRPPLRIAPFPSTLCLSTLCLSLSSAGALATERELSIDLSRSTTRDGIGLGFAVDDGRQCLGLRLGSERSRESGEPDTAGDGDSLSLRYARDIGDDARLLSRIGSRRDDDGGSTESLRLGADLFVGETIVTLALDHRRFDLVVELVGGRERERDGSATGVELALFRFVGETLALGARFARFDVDLDAAPRLVAPVTGPERRFVATSAATEERLFALVEQELAAEASVARGPWLGALELGVARAWLDGADTRFAVASLERALGDRWHVDASVAYQSTEGEDEGSVLGIGARFRF